eukprot:9032-Heterococcus_DN1.PRE.4
MLRATETSLRVRKVQTSAAKQRWNIWRDEGVPHLNVIWKGYKLKCFLWHTFTLEASCVEVLEEAMACREDTLDPAAGTASLSSAIITDSVSTLLLASNSFCIH